jgi:hypothetical protein
VSLVGIDRLASSVRPAPRQLPYRLGPVTTPRLTRLAA